MAIGSGETLRLTWRAEKVAADFDCAIDAFLFSCIITNKAPRTIDDYRERLQLFAEFCRLRNETPATVSHQTIADYVQFRLSKVTPQTVNHDLRVIKAFFHWLVLEGYREDDPTANFAKLKEPIPFPRTLSDEQVVALVNEIAKHADTFVGLRDLALVCLLLDTGIRISEAIEIQMEDLDFGLGFVRVFGKGRKERFVPLGETAKVILHRYLLRRAAITNAGEWLFISTLGTKLTRFQARKRLVYWAKKVGIEGVRVSPHSLRFTFVRKWLQSGGDSVVLSRILGHTSISMTSYYARLFATDLKDVHRRHSPIDALAPSLRIPRRRIQ